MDTTLITGFPAFTAKRMIKKIINETQERVYFIVRYQDNADISEFLEEFDISLRSHLFPLIGDITSMDLGLSTKEFRMLTAEVTCIHHMAARFHLGVSKDKVTEYNVGGTRGMIEFALECDSLRRFCFWSTAHVSGDRQGVIMEEELDCGQNFRNIYEETKFRAETIIQSMSRNIPTTIFRPSIIIGDSKTGEMGRYDGPYHLMRVLMNSPFNLQLPLPGKGEAPLNLVPIDYVVDAAFFLSKNPNALSRTFHLTDPSSLSAHAIYELVTSYNRALKKKKTLTTQIIEQLLEIPFFGKKSAHLSSKSVMEGFDQYVFYNARNTLKALRMTNIECPPFESYVDHIIRHIKDKDRLKKGVSLSDPLLLGF